MLHKILGNRLMLASLLPFRFDLGDVAFTAGMDKRIAPGPFYTAPIVQGDWDGTGVSDLVIYPQGARLGNIALDEVYANFDAEQGTIAFWITPEWDPADGIDHYLFRAGGTFYIRKSDTAMQFRPPGGIFNADISGWTAGTTYLVVARWDSKNTLDGTNYACLSINNSHTYGVTTPWTTTTVAASSIVGGSGAAAGADSADAIIEGLTICRRVMTSNDGYGTDVGNGDELTAIYAAGAGADPCLTTGSWDIVFCLPTNSTDEELVTGAGEAWSHPHADNIPDVWGMWDGGLPGTPFAVNGSNVANTQIGCGSDVAIDDLPAGANFQAEIWFLSTSDGTQHALLGKGLNGTRGWYVIVQADNTVRASTRHVTTSTFTPATTVLVNDGKWHHVVMDHVLATLTTRLALDGVWSAASVGVGAYVPDAADDMVFGGPLGFAELDGQYSWARLSDVQRYTPGTDFVPPRTPPGVDGNTLAQWNFTEGTGVTVDNAEGTATRDGTIAGGSWSSIWQVEGTPVVPQSLEFFGENDGIDFGSGANIDNLPNADCTIEFYGRFPVDIASGIRLFSKSDAGITAGWYIRTIPTGVRCIFEFDNTSAQVDIAGGLDDIFHHLAFDWDQGTLTLRSFLDGVFQNTSTAIGTYQADAAEDCILNGFAAVGAGDGPGVYGWIRLSDNRRYTGTAFAPPGRVNPPGNDANAHLLVNMTDGAGVTATDSSGNGYNGTISFGATTRWNNTPDMSIDEPGARVYNEGYNIGSDAADDGITIIETVTAETDYVIRAVISYGQSGRAWPEIYLYDNTNAAQIGADYDLPRMTDVHTGANDSATLINANGAFTQQLVGWTIYNITDGSSSVITAVSGDKTTITGALAGGTDDNWDTNDVYILRPPSSRPYAYHPNATEAIFVFRTPASCVSIDIKIRNDAAEGVLQVHQLEVLASLLDNGDHESLTGGNPDLITGWINVLLDAGDTESSAGSAGVIHAGAEALEWNVGAISGEGMYNPSVGVNGQFYAVGLWTYGDGAVGLQLIDAGGGAASAQQYLAVGTSYPLNTGAFWQHGAQVRRRMTGLFLAMYATTGAGGDRFSDDIYMFTLDDVALTVTPANQANSLEDTGIRVDGHDLCNQNATAVQLRPNSGDIQFSWTPRHSDTLAVSFGHISSWLFRADGGANNYIDLVFNAADNLRLQFNANGAGIQIGNWATGGGAIVPGVQYSIRILYNGTQMMLFVDGVLRITINALTGFAWGGPIPCYWGSTDVAIYQADAVYAAP